LSSLELAGVGKRFGETVAVADFSLSVAQGAYVALLGPSGCGKTTVMRLIAGIAEPDAGRILLGGRDVTRLPPERRGIGLVFQSYALFPHMTVGGNVAFGLRMRGVAAAERHQRVAAALALVDLGALGARWPRQLSGGQQQRVALARALVIEPAVLLLDEPLSNLDAALREQLREELHALQRRLGVTTLHVTHDQAEALALADRIVVMDRGRIVEQGAPDALYRRPQHRFTAEFLGHTNLIAATVQDGRMRLPWGEAPVANGLLPGAVLLSVRPEDLRLTADADGAGTVEDSSFQGRDIALRVIAGGLRLRARRSASAAPLPAGTRVRIGLPEHPHALPDPA
jgi:putative spermidine/putrescine transport system ATP-binding protein